jgi:hypothetical protein
MTEDQWDELYGHLIEDVRPFELGEAFLPGMTPYISGWKLNAQPIDAIPDMLPDAERDLDSREIVQNTDVYDTLNRDGLPAHELKPVWMPVLDAARDAARGLREDLDAWQGKDGQTLTPRQKQKATETLGQTVKDIFGGKA